jgi:hypothetical protein
MGCETGDDVAIHISESRSLMCNTSYKVPSRIIVGILAVYQDWETWDIFQSWDANGIHLVDAIGSTRRGAIPVPLREDVHDISSRVDDRSTRYANPWLNISAVAIQVGEGSL